MPFTCSSATSARPKYEDVFGSTIGRRRFVTAGLAHHRDGNLDVALSALTQAVRWTISWPMPTTSWASSQG
jgi:hypothetical protein